MTPDDSARNRKMRKMMSLNSSICLMPIWGWKGIQKTVLPSSARDVCVILPAFCGFMVSGKLLKQLGAFRASCRNPKNRIATRSKGLLSECGVIAISLYPTCTTTMLFACPIKPAGCIFPYETRGMLDICNGILEVFLWPAMLPVCHHWPPALWGGPGSFTITASWLRLTDMVTTLSMEAL